MDNKMLLTLLQNIIDQNHNILKGVKESKTNNLEESINSLGHLITNENNNIISECKKNRENKSDFDKLIPAIDSMFNNNLSKLKSDITNQIKTIKPTSNINNHNEYCLIGSDSKLSIKGFIAILMCMFLTWCCFKYLPSYISERSELNY